MINLYERMLSTRRGSNTQPPDHQSDAHPPKPAIPVSDAIAFHTTGRISRNVHEIRAPVMKCGLEALVPRRGD